MILIHSASNKVFPEVKETIAIGKKFGIKITPLMAASLAELYSLGQAIPENTQAIFVPGWLELL